MMSVLVVEDNDGIYQEFLRIFEHFDLKDIEFTRCPGLAEAFDEKNPLIADGWDIILVDFGFTHSYRVSDIEVNAHLSQKGSIIPCSHYRNGKDLIRFRRQLEEDTETIEPSYIVGIASNEDGNRLLKESGANVTVHKSNLVGLAHLLVNKSKGKDEAEEVPS